MSSSLLSAFKREGSDARASEAPSGLSIETMFRQIMTSLAKSSEEIAELRQECSDLRVANNSLERQLRDSVMNGRYGTPQGFMTPTAPASPLLRPKTPFLSANAIPTLMTPPAVFAPSALGDNRASKTYQADQIREIEGFYVVIPAGGAGTRLWPLSREGHPKFLLDLTLKGRSLIQATWDRLLPLTGQLRTAVVAGPAHVKGINEQLPDLLPQMLFTEPGPKDSMAAIGLAAAVLGKRDPDAVIGSFAADHMISGDEAFLSAVTEAVQVARQGYITTIGIAPSHPSTGFGYIRLGDRLAIDGAPNARIVSSFKEKPDARTAAAYIATGSYRWNAGMFVVKATVLLEELEKYKPELAEGLRRIADAWDGDEGKRQRVLEEVWPTLEKIPIDNAVAEPAAQEGKVAVVPATFGWDDVGDFSSLADLLPADASQPRILGDSGLVLTEQVAGGIVVPGSGRLVAALGVDDLVIVDMPDTLMVTTRARSQEVKKLVAKAKALGWKTLL